jgi:ubiquinone/menaquinone biosynthesis C-methylase UbiE
MEPKLQRRVQRYGWDRAVDHYERHWSRQLEPARARLLEMAELKPGERVLDVACGTGLVTLPAAEAVGPEGSVVGTDLSGEMVEAVRTAGERRGIENLSVERMGAEELDLPDESFDVALCALGLMYAPDPTAAIREMHRVLVPGGRVVGAVWGARANCGWAEIFPIVDSRVHTQVCPLFFQLGTGASLASALESCGFVEAADQRLATIMPYESEEDALGAAFAGGPVALAYSRFEDAVREEAHAEYLTSIEPYRDGEGYLIPGEFVVARGLKR